MTKPTSETPFFLVYGAEAVLPTKLKYGSLWVLTYNDASQDALRYADLALLTESRSQAAIRAAHYQQGLR